MLFQNTAALLSEKYCGPSMGSFKSVQAILATTMPVVPNPIYKVSYLLGAFSQGFSTAFQIGIVNGTAPILSAGNTPTFSITDISFNAASGVDLTETRTPTDHGVLYGISLSFGLIGDSPKLNAFVTRLSQEAWCFVLEDHLGNKKLLGTKANPLTLTAQFQTPSTITGTTGYKLSFSYTSASSYIYIE
jgi:hypothetical protein